MDLSSICVSVCMWLWLWISLWEMLPSKFLEMTIRMYLCIYLQDIACIMHWQMLFHSHVDAHSVSVSVIHSSSIFFHSVDRFAHVNSVHSLLYIYRSHLHHKYKLTETHFYMKTYFTSLRPNVIVWLEHIKMSEIKMKHHSFLDKKYKCSFYYNFVLFLFGLSWFQVYIC